jgi:site-specific DNA-adenine methylase
MNQSTIDRCAGVGEDGRVISLLDADEAAEAAIESHERGYHTGPFLKAPFPWFGGKSRVAPLVWDRFGDVDNYVEPFAGSLAVLLGRPHREQTETVNDLDCYLANFWRALAADPLDLAYHADWPVNEADLHARHLWLVNQIEFREKMKTDPDFYDVKIAGWWVWGISQWIGSGWCSRPEWMGRTNAGAPGRGIHRKRPQTSGDNAGHGVHRKLLSLGDKGREGNSGMGVSRQLPHLGDAGMGVSRQLPHLGSAGMGEQPPATALKRPNLGGRGTGNGIHGDAAQTALEEYMLALSARLRRVRVCCGDWTRVLGPSVTIKHGVCGVFLDPPYDMRVVAERADGLYSGGHDNELSKAVRAWAVENGNNPLLRIALCGYEGEHEMPADWECVHWKAHGGYGSQRGGSGNQNSARERIWFSPHCVKQPSLF